MSYHKFYLLLITLTLFTVCSVPSVFSASHREAPLIALDPAADTTDVYAFRSWENPDNVVFILNTSPGQDPADGPNYFSFDDNVLYQFHIDNDQNGQANDIVYEVRFKSETRPALGSLNFPLPFVGNINIAVPELQGITALDGAGSEGLTRRQTYTITEVRNNQRKQLFKNQMLVAVPSNVGPATMPNYEGLVEQGIYNDPDTEIRVFAGQRAETFYIDLGAVFDTVNLRRPVPVLTLSEDDNDHINPFGTNRFSGFNINSIAIEIPIAHITRDQQTINTTQYPIIGMYASTSRQRIRLLRGDDETIYAGNFVQVSRMANPLINELIIDTPSKDKWNGAKPSSEAQFQDFFKAPSLATALNLIFNLPVPETPRTDLMQVFLKYPGQPLNGTKCGSPCSELLRVNMGIEPTNPANQRRMGVLAGDFAGFPNGRRPNDDVTDIAVRVVGGSAFLEARVGDGVNFLEDAPGSNLTDNGIYTVFPFLPTPHDGRNRRHIDCDEAGVNTCN